MSCKEELRFLWNLVWDPAKYTKRKLNFGAAIRLYYMLAAVPFVAYVVLGLISVYLGLPSHRIGATHLLTPLYILFASSSYLSVIWGGIVLFFILLPIGMAIDAVVYQIIVKFFLNMWKGSYDTTFTALVYSSFPILLLLWLSVLPLFNSLFIIVAPIWSIVVLVIALSNQQNVTRLNALLAIVIKSALLIFVLALISVSIFSAAVYVLSSVIPVSSIGPLSNITANASASAVGGHSIIAWG